jgi:hypothetical protein
VRGVKLYGFEIYLFGCEGKTDWVETLFLEFRGVKVNGL